MNEQVEIQEINFNVFNHPLYGSKAVKNGFSWPAFFFGPLWAWWSHGMAGLGCALFAGQLLIGTAAIKLIDNLALLFLFDVFFTTMWHFFIGHSANSWLRTFLTKTGYSLIKENVDAISLCSYNTKKDIIDKQTWMVIIATLCFISLGLLISYIYSLFS